jgi:D-alanyl-D-alanine-carboxypeptidase/D-alanyl-D-alanine-endopeptidase
LPRLRRSAVLIGCLVLSGVLPAEGFGQTSATPAVAGARAFPSDADVLAIIRQRVEEKRSAGIVVGLLEADGRTRVVSYGDPGPGRPALDASSVFEIGSISKVFTSTLLALMVQDGTVKLDDPVQKYLPAGVKLPTRNGKAITLASLSEQNSGLPRMPANFRPADPTNPFADYTTQQMYDFLSSYTLTRDPGETFEYSNLGVGLLGSVLASIAGKSYEELVRERILVPLGMTHTAITHTLWMQSHLALGHDAAGTIVPNWDFQALAGAGAIRSTADDMLKFAAANLNPDRGPVPRAMASAQKARALAGGDSIGLNWITSRRGGGNPIVWHNGGTYGYRTFLGLQPSTHRAVVILTNSGGAGADDIGMHLLNPALPLAPKPAPMKQRVVIDVGADVLAGYVGTYQLAPTMAIVVTLKDGALYAAPTGEPGFRLWPESEREFFLKEVDAQVSFVREGGAVTALVLHQGGRDQRGAKVP